MRFDVLWWVSGIALSERDLPLRLEYRGSVSVEFRGISGEDRQKLIHPSVALFGPLARQGPADALLLIATTTREVPDSLLSEFRWLEERRVPESVVDGGDQIALNRLEVHDDRTFDEGRVPDLRLMSGEFRAFVGDVQKDLADIAFRTARVLRWKTAQLGPPDPFHLIGALWSPRSDDPRWIPGELRMQAEGVATKVLPPEIPELVEDIVVAGGDEPVARLFLGEAREHRRVNPRSQVVLAMIAAESAAAELRANGPVITTQRRREAWVDALERHLEEDPRIERNGWASAIVPRLRAGWDLRNDIVHRRRIDVPIDEANAAWAAALSVVDLADEVEGA